MLKRAIGMMSGTSMDGVDIALIETDGVQVETIGPAMTKPYGDDVRAALRAALKAAAAGDIATVAAAERLVTEAHIDAMDEFRNNFVISNQYIDLIGFHGHTVYHAPELGRTWQIGDAAHLAERTGIPVAHDFRTSDVAAGGEGAPLLPVYHGARAAHFDVPVAILNIGGVANVTFVPPGGDPEALLAFDTGPGNALLDDWIFAASGLPMDEGGRIAASGKVDEAALRALLSNPYFDRPAPKSLDRNAFDISFLDGMCLADGAATLAAFTVDAVMRASEHFPEPAACWYLCGGGRYNSTIVNALKMKFDVPVESVETLGWRGDTLEAEGFAFLAVRASRGLPLSYPKTTGVPSPQKGGRIISPP